MSAIAVAEIAYVVTLEFFTIPFFCCRRIDRRVEAADFPAGARESHYDINGVYESWSVGTVSPESRRPDSTYVYELGTLRNQDRQRIDRVAQWPSAF